MKIECILLGMGIILHPSLSLVESPRSKLTRQQILKQHRRRQEQDQQEDNDKAEQEQNNAQNDIAKYDSEYYASLKGRLKLSRRCNSSIVYVDRIYLTCDSPGDDGEGYRQSSRCKYGDEAHMYLFCKCNSMEKFTIWSKAAAFFSFISKDTISEQYSWSGIDVSVDAGVLDSFVNIQPYTDLCGLDSITYLGNPVNQIYSDGDDAIYCPNPGSYQLFYTFDVPKGGGDPQLQYTPDIRLRFISHKTNATLGCAGTGTVATVDSSHRRQGEIALGLALTMLFAIFGICLCMTYQRKKKLESVDDWHRQHRWSASRRPAEEVISVDSRGSYSMDMSEQQRYHYHPTGGGRLPRTHPRQMVSEPPRALYPSSVGRGYVHPELDEQLSETSSIPFSVDPSSLGSQSLQHLNHTERWSAKKARAIPQSIRHVTQK
jgi:hypothetical protein